MIYNYKIRLNKMLINFIGGMHMIKDFEIKMRESAKANGSKGFLEGVD